MRCLSTYHLVGPRLVLLAAAVVVASCFGEESPGDKQEWSILQTLEWSTRTETMATVRFERSGDYEVMGVPRVGDSRIIWVLLKPTHGALYKQMPEGNYWIDQQLWSDLSSTNRLTSTVAQALKGHVGDVKQVETLAEKDHLSIRRPIAR